MRTYHDATIDGHQRIEVRDWNTDDKEGINYYDDEIKYKNLPDDFNSWKQYTCGRKGDNTIDYTFYVMSPDGD